MSQGASPGIWVCGGGAGATALARALAAAARVYADALPGPVLTTAAATARSARQVRAAWRALEAVDAVVIQPALALAAGRRNPGLAAWKRGINASLRAAFLVARAAGAALERQGGGALIVVVEPVAADDPIAAVASDTLACLVDGLGRALDGSVQVGEIRVASRRTSAATVARSVLQVVGGRARAPLPNVRSSAGSRG